MPTDVRQKCGANPGRRRPPEYLRCSPGTTHRWALSWRSGKSRLARQLAERTGLPLVERDGVGEEGSPGYLSAIAQMAARPRWILDGAPYYADELVYSAADTVVFLDYRKAW
jgi:hypothetical protein